MNDESDARWDEFYDSVRADLTDEIIQEFTSERVTSVYHKRPHIAEKPYLVLLEARSLFASSHFTAAHIHAVIASEVLIKKVLIEPMVMGFVHTEALAELLTEMMMKGTMGRFGSVQKVFKTILNDVAGIDLDTYQRSGFGKPLWDEILSAQARRNAFVHKAEVATKAEAELAISIAGEIVEVVFPRFAKSLRFHVHNGFELCSKQECNPEWVEMCKRLGIAQPTPK
jgi:hypothetical protein